MEQIETRLLKMAATADDMWVEYIFSFQAVFLSQFLINRLQKPHLFHEATGKFCQAEIKIGMIIYED